MTDVVQLAEAIKAELEDVFVGTRADLAKGIAAAAGRTLSIEGMTKTFIEHARIVGSDLSDKQDKLSVDPLRADITPPVEVGIGFAVTRQPAGSVSFCADTYLVAITVAVVGTLTTGYKILMYASEFLARSFGMLSTTAAEIGNSTTSLPVAQVQDEGESNQGVDDLDNYTLTRNFTISIER